VKKRFGIFSALVIAIALTLTGCSSSDSSTSEAASCAKEDLATVTEGKLTIATGEPAYYPWIIDDAPETGNGFEGAEPHHLMRLKTRLVQHHRYSMTMQQVSQHLRTSRLMVS